MSQITPELKLVFWEGTNPREYELRVTIDGQPSSTHVAATYSGNMNTPNVLYVVNVNMTQSSQGLVNRRIDLGQLNIDPQNGEIEVNLMDGSTQIGFGSIRVEEAQQETRPLVFQN